MDSSLYPIERLYEAIRDDEAKAARNKGGSSRRIRASEAGNCARQIFYRISGHRAAPRSSTSVMLGVGGDADHDVTRQMLGHYGIEVRKVSHNEDGSVDELLMDAVEFDCELPDGTTERVTFSSRADGEIDVPEGVALLEIKGMSYWPFKYLKDAVKKGPEATLAHLHKKHRRYLYQVEITMRIFGYDRVYFVFKDRSFGTLLGHLYERDDELWAQIRREMGLVWKAVREGEPPRPLIEGSSDCSWCPYHYLCHGAMKREQQGKEPAVLYPERGE